MSDIISELAQVLQARKQADPDTSYVARLYHDGLDAILKKMLPARWFSVRQKDIEMIGH